MSDKYNTYNPVQYKEMPEEELELNSNRTMCSILEDMRDCKKTLNFRPLKGLIEEAQIRANRMEDGLYATRRAGFQMNKIINNETLSAEQKLEAIKEILNKRWKTNSQNEYD